MIFGATTVMGALRQPRRMVWARLLSVPVMLGVALGLSHGLGATGAAIGFLVGYTACAIFAWAQVPRAVRGPAPYSDSTVAVPARRVPEEGTP